jgi:hypothetical protein
MNECIISYVAHVLRPEGTANPQLVPFLDPKADKATTRGFRHVELGFFLVGIGRLDAVREDALGYVSSHPILLSLTVAQHVQPVLYRSGKEQPVLHANHVV